ncbi:MAG: gliding motility-associated C-terminal domain-containing protein [Bacteroidetes bacterium]|nr:gliding motility-associated C-terminal domain-containing protein [Bacteroidota bacterium]
MNPFFAYLIKSTVSLALFYIVFKLAVSRDKMHSVNRFVLLGILVVSSIIPFADIPILQEAEVIPRVEVFRELVAAPVFIAPSPVSENIQTVQQTKHISINPYLIFYLLIISSLFVRFLISVFRVLKIINGAEKQPFRKVVLAVVKDFIQPFSFIKHIVISEKDYTENREIVVAHEYAHIKHLHAIDLLICELFTALHWFNPFMWFLRHDLKLIHEFQSDQAVLNKGIDATQYQLLVLQKSVGERRFAMANHFTQKPILKRLKMMQKKNGKQWKGVKLILFIPIVLLLLQAFARPEMLVEKASEFVPVFTQENETEKWLERWRVENIGNGFFQPELESPDTPRKENNVFVILMNRRNQLLIENVYAEKENVKEIVKGFLYGKNRDGKIVVDYEEKEIPFIGKQKVSKGFISFRNDLDTSEDEMNLVFRSIGEACLEVRKEKAQILFGEDYFALEDEKQEAINMAVPIWVSIESPKRTVKPPPPPAPARISLEKDGVIYMSKKKYSFKSLEEKLNNGRISWEKLYKKWESEYKNLKADTQIKARVYVSEDVSENELNQLKEVFRNAKILEKNVFWIVDDKQDGKKSQTSPPKAIGIIKDGKIESIDTQKPPPPPPPIFIMVNKEGEYYFGETVYPIKDKKEQNIAWNNPITLEELQKMVVEKIEFWERIYEEYNTKYELISNVYVLIGAPENAISKLKEILRKAKILHVNFAKDMKATELSGQSNHRKINDELSIPEGFSPNNDGVHDFFKIAGIYPRYPDAKLMVFNIQGNKVFEKENYGNYNVWGKDNAWWRGTSEKRVTKEKSDKLPAGDYVYVLELGNGIAKKGTVMLALSPPPKVVEVLP